MRRRTKGEKPGFKQGHFKAICFRIVGKLYRLQGGMGRFEYRGKILDPQTSPPLKFHSNMKFR